jgi:hypothetical protein
MLTSSPLRPDGTPYSDFHPTKIRHLYGENAQPLQSYQQMNNFLWFIEYVSLPEGIPPGDYCAYILLQHMGVLALGADEFNFLRGYLSLPDDHPLYRAKDLCNESEEREEDAHQSPTIYSEF